MQSENNSIFMENITDMIQEFETQVGNIDEQGYLNGLNTKGFNHFKALLELSANSIIDAKAKNLTFEIKDDTILIIDDGIGMSKIKFKNMFSMHRENHSTDHSSGIAGVGGKIALMILSNKTLVEVFSFDGSKYNKAIVPWDRMFEEGKYTNMITTKPMTTEEIVWFKTKLTNTGTIIKFKYNKTTFNAIECNFKKPKDEVTNLNDYIYIVFGKYNGKIIYRNLTINKEKDFQLEPYNYFGGDHDEYYTGKSKEIIHHYYNEETEDSRYIYYNEEDKLSYEFKKKNGGYSKNIEPISDKLDDYSEVCKYEVVTGQRKDVLLFNDAVPNDSVNIEYVNSAGEKNCSYDKRLIETTITNYSSYFRKGSLYRNTQKIGDFEMTGHKANSARANAESKHKINNVRTEVSYAPVSYHGNIPDKVMGIQENKNQWESKDMPVSLTRMFEHFHNKKATEIWKYFIRITSQTHVDSFESDESYESSESAQSDEPIVISDKPIDIIHDEPIVISDKPIVVIPDEPIVVIPDEPIVVIPNEEVIINICERYINCLKENNNIKINSKTLEIYKLQCELLLEISP